MDEELADLLEEEEERRISAKDIFNAVTINRVKKVSVRADLVDSDGEELDIEETIESLVSYVKDKLSKENAEDPNNQIANQVLPVMAESAAATLLNILGPRLTMLYLSNPEVKDAIIISMIVGFLLLKFIQQNDLTIQTSETPMTDEEIEEVLRMAQVNNIAAGAAAAGFDPAELLNQLIDKGLVSEDEINEILDSMEKDDEEE